MFYITTARKSFDGNLTKFDIIVDTFFKKEDILLNNNFKILC